MSAGQDRQLVSRFGSCSTAALSMHQVVSKVCSLPVVVCSRQGSLHDCASAVGGEDVGEHRGRHQNPGAAEERSTRKARPKRCDWCAIATNIINDDLALIVGLILCTAVI